MRVVVITRPDLEETHRLLRKAAGRRGLQYTELVAGAAGGSDLSAVCPRLIYCAATDAPSVLLEKLVARPGDALLHDPFFGCDHQPITLQRAGLPLPRTVFLPSMDLETLAAQVEWLGGWPVVVKLPGHEGGAGVSRAKDMGELTEVLEACGFDALMQSFVPHVRSWRLTVLGDRVLASSASEAAEGDFRTNAEGSTDLGPGTPPEGAEEIAIKAARALKLDFGGADILEGPDGSLSIAEFNFPCYFAEQQAATGVDIAGHMLEHLAGKID